MRERLNRAVSKTVEPLRVPWVRIPPSPPFRINKLEIGRLALGVISPNEVALSLIRLPTRSIAYSSMGSYHNTLPPTLPFDEVGRI